MTTVEKEVIEKLINALKESLNDETLLDEVCTQIDEENMAVLRKTITIANEFLKGDKDETLGLSYNRKPNSQITLTFGIKRNLVPTLPGSGIVTSEAPTILTL